MKDAERELSRKLAERFEPEPDFDVRTIDSSEWVKRDLHISERWVGTMTSQRWWIWTNQNKWEPRSYREPDRVVWMLKELLQQCSSEDWCRFWLIAKTKDFDFEHKVATALAGQQEE